jgi:hypothetical protein
MAEATYTSVWDGGLRLNSKALVEEKPSGLIKVEEIYDADGLNVLDDEFVTLNDGRTFSVVHKDDGMHLGDERARC